MTDDICHHDSSDGPYRPLITSQAELEKVWRHLMQPLGFSHASIWMMVIDADHRPVPQLVEIEDADGVPDAEALSAFAAFLDHLGDGHDAASFAFLRSRPGHGIEELDRSWARFLYDAARAAGVRLEVVHLATDSDVVPLPADEVGLPRSA